MMAARSRSGRPRHVPGRRLFSDGEKSKIAWMAGQGHSAAEIANSIGNTTPASIYAHVRRQGLSLVQKPPTSTAFVVRATHAQFEALTNVAMALDADPAEMASRILHLILSEPVLLKNLLDEDG